MFFRLLDKLLGIHHIDLDPLRESNKAEPPSWDVPLDQATSIIRIEGDTLRR